MTFNRLYLTGVSAREEADCGRDAARLGGDAQPAGGLRLEGAEAGGRMNTSCQIEASMNECRFLHFFGTRRDM